MLCLIKHTCRAGGVYRGDGEIKDGINVDHNLPPGNCSAPISLKREGRSHPGTGICNGLAVYAIRKAERLRRDGGETSEIIGQGSGEGERSRDTITRGVGSADAGKGVPGVTVSGV